MSTVARLLPLLFLLILPDALMAQDHPDYRPGLFFREDWKEIPAALPVTPDHVAHADLTLNLYGPGRDGIKKSHHDQPVDDPYYIWSGQCGGNWMVTLRHRQADADLSDYAKVRWRTKQAGFRHLRLALKLADGTWLVSDQADGPTTDWRVREFIIGDLRWRTLDPETITEGAWAEAPDLSRVEEIGFTDLMRGGGSAACSRLDWIEVYARSAAR